MSTHRIRVDNQAEDHQVSLRVGLIIYERPAVYFNYCENLYYKIRYFVSVV